MGIICLLYSPSELILKCKLHVHGPWVGWNKGSFFFSVVIIVFHLPSSFSYTRHPPSPILYSSVHFSLSVFKCISASGLSFSWAMPFDPRRSTMYKRASVVLPSSYTALSQPTPTLPPTPPAWSPQWALLKEHSRAAAATLLLRSWQGLRGKRLIGVFFSARSRGCSRQAGSQAAAAAVCSVCLLSSLRETIQLHIFTECMETNEQMTEEEK